MDYIDIIEKSIYNIDSKICGIIDDYKVLQDSQKVADYVIQFLRTYLEHIAARIYAHENPNKQVPIRGKDKWYTQYMKPLKENNEYGYIWDLHHSLQITTSHYVPAEDGAIRLMDGYLSQLYQLRDQMREKFGLVLMSNLEGYPQEKNFELDPYYEKIYIALKGIHLEDGTKYTNDRYYITRKKYRTVNGKGFFEYTLSYAQEEITKFDRFVAYSFNDIPDNYSIQCDFAQANVDFNGVDIDIKCLIAWNVSIRPCELEKLAAICGYDIEVRTDNLYYKALMKFLSRTGMNLLDILLADEEDYEIYIQQVELSKKPELEETFDKIREIIIGEKPGSNILRYITAYLKNDVIRDQLADRSNNRLSYLYLKNEAIPFDEMPYASSLCGHNLLKSRLNKCLEIYDCEHQYVSAMVNKEAYDSKLIDCECEGKSIVKFGVKKRIERDSDADYSEEIVPFQIAYAVSIHKAQGLEYESVKVVITEDVDERISHNIFYTAITRTTDRLKIYMSKETQNKLAEKFVKSNVGLQQAQLFAGHAGLKLKNKLSS